MKSLVTGATGFIGSAITRSGQLKKHPAATVSEVKIGHLGETYDCTKAATELGLPRTPVRESIRRAVAWFKANGYLR